jgi:membrane protease YdiL (CAAX protease family)
MFDVSLLAEVLPLAGSLPLAEVLPQEAPEVKVSTYLSVALLTVSCCVWIWLFGNWQRGKAAIPSVPRRLVPWRGGEVLFVIGFLLVLTIGSSLASPSEAEPLGLDEFARMFLVGSAFNIGLASAVGLFLFFARQADGHDLGVVPKFPDDVAIGGMGWLAAILPVYALQIVLVNLVADDRQTHPLLETLLNAPRFDVLALAFFAAVIVAPLVEEFFFRVLLQGWLEKRFAPRIVREAAVPIENSSGTDIGPEITTASEPADVAEHLPGYEFQPTAPSPVFDNAWDAYRSPETELRPPETNAADETLPAAGWRGMAPIAISSFLFAAAHAGTWPDPAPLFVLALVLGYLYRQTHRLWPCVILHMLFNGLSLAMVWFGAQ